MQKQHHDPRPGMLFVDRYMPGASNDEREEAYKNVRQLIAVLVRINERLMSEERERSDSRESDSCDRVEGVAKTPGV